MTEPLKLIDCKVKIELMPYQLEIIKSLIKSEELNLLYNLRSKEPNFTKEERSQMITDYHRLYNMLENSTKE